MLLSLEKTGTTPKCAASKATFCHEERHSYSFMIDDDFQTLQEGFQLKTKGEKWYLPLHTNHHIGLPLSWKALSENTTHHQQHRPYSVQKSPSNNYLLVIGQQL